MFPAQSRHRTTMRNTVMKRSGVRNKHRTRELRFALAAHLSPRVVGGPGINSAPLIFNPEP